jgi:hypothetical protein
LVDVCVLVVCGASFKWGVSMKWMIGAMSNAMNRRRGKARGAKIDAKMRIFLPSCGLGCTFQLVVL